MPDQDIHVGDIGTVYDVPIYDDDLTPANFDPTSATVKQLLFEMPGASATLTRTATATQVTIEGVPVWCLTYTVVAGDVVTGEFHMRHGIITIQAHLEFGPTQKWSSSKVRTDQHGRLLRVSSNL